MYFCGMTSPTSETALLSARCIYWLLFKKTPKQSLCSRLDRYPSHQNHFVCKCWYFRLRTSLRLVGKWMSKPGCRSLKKQLGFNRSLCACNKKAFPIDFSSFVCYLKRLKFAKARDFAIYTEPNFSYCVKSSSATNARLFNTEENRSSIEKLGLWLLHKCLQYGICEIGCPVVKPSQTSLLSKEIVNCEFCRLL